LTAETAGLHLNDVILLVDGEPVADQASLNTRLDRVPAEGSIRLTLLRRGEKREITLKPAY
jgi:S1-C subfamily serine protease